MRGLKWEGSCTTEPEPTGRAWSGVRRGDRCRAPQLPASERAGAASGGRRKRLVPGHEGRGTAVVPSGFPSRWRMAAEFWALGDSGFHQVGSPSAWHSPSGRICLRLAVMSAGGSDMLSLLLLWFFGSVIVTGSEATHKCFCQTSALSPDLGAEGRATLRLGSLAAWTIRKGRALVWAGRP